jgi:hypothetical protein
MSLLAEHKNKLKKEAKDKRHHRETIFRAGNDPGSI